MYVHIYSIETVVILRVFSCSGPSPMLPGSQGRTLTEPAMAYCVDGIISGANASMVTSFMHSPKRHRRMPTMNLAPI